MKMNKIDKLVQLLQRFNSGESIEEVEQDAKDFLSEISATDLSIAEQELIDNGMEPEDLRGLCVIHMQMLEGEIERMAKELDPEHPIAIMIKEHDILLRGLEELERVNNAIQTNPITTELQQELLAIAHLLTGAEKHHEREEKALFPALEELGIAGPPTVMRLEHDNIRPKKHELEELAKRAFDIDLGEFRKQLASVSSYIIFNLRDHIFKENHILYPSAVETITDIEKWESIEKECDLIGYCFFTPNK